MAHRESSEKYNWKQEIREKKYRHGSGLWAALILAILFLLSTCCCGASADEPEEQAEYQIFTLNSDAVRKFESDYGFSENRAWVLGRGERKRNPVYLINTEGEIIYEVPGTVMIDGVSTRVEFESFYPVENGMTYFTGRANQYHVSVIIDADGNELAHYISTDEQDCYIFGRSDDRFLLVCFEKNGAEMEKMVFVPIGCDGKPADVPRLISENIPWYMRDEMYDMGDGYFRSYNEVEDRVTFYNLNNNTVQNSIVWGQDDNDCRFYHGVTLVNAVRLDQEQLQEDRVNFAPTNKDGRVNKEETVSQTGRVWTERHSYLPNAPFPEGIYDQDGKAINIPDEIEGANVIASDDGYVLFEDIWSHGETRLSMMDPENNFLYVQKAFPDDTTPMIGRGGYAVITSRDMGKYSCGLVDREGNVHSFSEDLSSLPGLSELKFKGFGSGIVLETKGHITSGNFGDYEDSVVIRSLDGKNEISSARKTGETKTMSETLAGGTAIDLSQARPVGTVQIERVKNTEEDEIRAMGEDGIIVVDDVLDEIKEILLFEQDGVSVYLHYISGSGWNMKLKNENINNQSAFIMADGWVGYNGIYLKGHGGSRGAKAGETASFLVMSLDEGQFVRKMSGVAAGLSEMPLNEITLVFDVQIGSKSELVHYSRTLRSSSYSEDQLSALYGEKVGDYGQRASRPVYTAYRVRDDRSVVFVISNNKDEQLDAGALVGFARCQWMINGERYDSTFSLHIPPKGAELVSLGNIDDIYKNVELPNGTPLHVELSIPKPGGELMGDMIVLDLGQISNTPEDSRIYSYQGPSSVSAEQEENEYTDAALEKDDNGRADLNDEFELVGDQLFHNGQLFCDFTGLYGIKQIQQIGDQFWILNNQGSFYAINMDLQILSADLIPLDPDADYVLNQYGLFETTYDENDEPICTKRMAADGSIITEYPNMTAEDVLAPYIKNQ